MRSSKSTDDSQVDATPALDLRAVLAVLGRVSHVFTANFRGGLPAATTIIERLLGILNLNGVRSSETIITEARDAFEQLYVSDSSILLIMVPSTSIDYCDA